MATSNTITLAGADDATIDVETHDGKDYVELTVSEEFGEKPVYNMELTPSQARDLVDSLMEALMDLDVVR
jgi:hypothetical protein